ncbi:uncharacterized protein (TIGR03083 family) [Allocatelliglobosispora scoriae]|uniref:Uncharacterized protein (TIGR03083 family) n=1 Tax=Allocatelliglobosispora scoriae TaxID=643052 RepID=A0A841BS17_9ACTN|nr:maleylpyruvate isomerase family mycothiol-dependent enzyme [Allocatelliglobosispora scoriae]MBB5871034.1 uncharacterized protein (TIGR03083 family) [Allocatelliglobosispora scoriae]
MAEPDYVAAVCTEGLRSLVKLGARLDDEHWAAATDCPQWSVGDIFAHIVGIEQWREAGGIPFTGPLQEWIDAPVEARRGRPRQEVLDELSALVAARDEQCAALPVEAFAPAMGRMVPTEFALSLRVFDLFTHEHDIRGAIGRPGSMGGRSAEIVRNLLLQSLPKTVVKDAGAEPGSGIRFTVIGDVPLDAAVHVAADGRGSLSAPWRPGPPTTAHATMSWQAFARLGAGRGSRADHEILITGDGALAERVIAHLNVAP